MQPWWIFQNILNILKILLLFQYELFENNLIM